MTRITLTCDSGLSWNSCRIPDRSVVDTPHSLETIVVEAFPILL